MGIDVYMCVCACVCGRGWAWGGLGLLGLGVGGGLFFFRVIWKGGEGWLCSPLGGVVLPPLWEAVVRWQGPPHMAGFDFFVVVCLWMFVRVRGGLGGSWPFGVGGGVGLVFLSGEVGGGGGLYHPIRGVGWSIPPHREVVVRWCETTSYTFLLYMCVCFCMVRGWLLQL